MLSYNSRWKKNKRQWPQPKTIMKMKMKKKRNGRTPNHWILNAGERLERLSMFIKYLHQYFISNFASEWFVTLFVNKIFFGLNIQLMVFDVEHWTPHKSKSRKWEMVCIQFLSCGGRITFYNKFTNQSNLCAIFLLFFQSYDADVPILFFPKKPDVISIFIDLYWFGMDFVCILTALFVFYHFHNTIQLNIKQKTTQRFYPVKLCIQRFWVMNSAGAVPIQINNNNHNEQSIFCFRF